MSRIKYYLAIALIAVVANSVARRIPVIAKYL